MTRLGSRARAVIQAVSGVPDGDASRAVLEESHVGAYTALCYFTPVVQLSVMLWALIAIADSEKLSHESVCGRFNRRGRELTVTGHDTGSHVSMTGFVLGGALVHFIAMVVAGVRLCKGMYPTLGSTSLARAAVGVFGDWLLEMPILYAMGCICFPVLFVVSLTRFWVGAALETGLFHFVSCTARIVTLQYIARDSGAFVYTPVIWYFVLEYFMATITFVTAVAEKVCRPSQGCIFIFHKTIRMLHRPMLLALATLLAKTPIEIVISAT